MSHGLVVGNITAFIIYNPVVCFKQFTYEVVAARRKADANTRDGAAGNMAKLISEIRRVSKRNVFSENIFLIKYYFYFSGNALYGKTNKEKFVNVSFCKKVKNTTH